MNLLAILQSQQNTLEDTLNDLAARGADELALAQAKTSLTEAFSHLAYAVRHIEPHYHVYECGCGERYSIELDPFDCPACEGLQGPAKVVLCRHKSA